MRLPWPFSVRAAGYLHYVYSQQLRAVHLLDKDWLPHLLPVWMKTLQSSQKKRKKKKPTTNKRTTSFKWHIHLQSQGYSFLQIRAHFPALVVYNRSLSLIKSLSFVLTFLLLWDLSVFYTFEQEWNCKKRRPQNNLFPLCYYVACII